MSATTAFVNGSVVTVSGSLGIAEAVAVSGNRIVAVGRNEDVRPFINSKTEVIDLKGKTLLPGFIDAHAHLTLYGTNLMAVNCKDDRIKSIGNLLDALKEKARETPAGQWIRAWGFDNTRIEERRYPSRWELDAVSTEHPIIVTRVCGHISVVNSKALELAGITKETSDPEGGRIERDAQGEPTGVLVESAHMRMVELAKYEEAELRKGIRLGAEEFLKNGVTTIHDAGGYGSDNMRVLQQMIWNSEVKLRVYALICTLNTPETYLQQMMDAGILTGCGDEWFKLGPAKVFIDGSSTGPNIATRKGYTSNPAYHGITYYSQEELNRLLGTAHEKGYQITAHAQGDRAIEMLLNCIESALARSPRDNHRHRIEHCGIAMPDLVERMKRLNVVPVINPPFIYEFGDIYLEHYGERVNHMYAARDLTAMGIVTAAGSDCPVADVNPLIGIFAAVTRQSRSGNEIGKVQSVDIMTAIKMYTWNGAYAAFEENRKGSIEPGKLADLVVLDQDILRVPPEDIKDVKVTLTMVNGEVVFAS